jgi:hypothetical protein
VNAGGFNIVITINGGTVSIINLAVENGGHDLQADNVGGGIVVGPTASLTLTDSVVSGEHRHPGCRCSHVRHAHHGGQHRVGELR